MYLLNWFVRFLKIKFKNFFYNFFFIQGIGYLNSYDVTSYNGTFDFGILFYKWYIISLSIRIFYLVSSFHEIYLLYLRILILSNKKNTLLLKRYILLIMVIPIAIIVPIQSGASINLVNDDRYNLGANTFS